MNIEILPPRGKVKYLGQLITIKNAVQVEFEHRIKCVWSTFTTHRLELTSPKYPLRDRLKLFDATVTPSLFYASGTWTMTQDMVKKRRTTQRRMMGMIIHPQRQPGTSCAAAQAASASVGVIADAEAHDPDSELVDDTTEHNNNQDLNEPRRGQHSQLRRNHRRQSTKRAAGSVDYMTRATHKADDMFAAKRNHVVDLRAEPDLREAGKE